LGCRAEIDLQILTPATVNKPDVAARIQEVARRLFPGSDVDTANQITMGSEDFASVLQKVPGCFFFIGSANPDKGLVAGHHNPKFDIDEEALPRGAALMTATVMDILKV
jgi:amidohydrolase